MIELSVTPLDPNHIDEICEDIVAQQREGVYIGRWQKERILTFFSEL